VIITSPYCVVGVEGLYYLLEVDIGMCCPSSLARRYFFWRGVRALLDCVCETGNGEKLANAVTHK